MKTAPAPNAPRKTPVQSRSRERVERILDAAAHVFADVGYEAATTDAIAERAQASIGSLYQFFPNKQALFDAVASRHLERASALFDALLAAVDGGASWESVLERAIDGFAALERADPNLRAVWRNWHVAGGFLAAGDALNREFAKRTEAVLARHAEKLPKAKRELVATMVVEVISSMLFVVARRRGPTADAVLGETKVMLRRYLEPYARPSGRGVK
jgi:AcrR family transcriptional regulator